MNSNRADKSDGIEILIVEDSPTQAEQLQHILERHGYSVSHARNGKEAVVRLRAHKPTLVISDINMPEMDGFQLCRRIRSDEQLQDLPVILLTALTDADDVIRGLECGADNFITKPFEEGYLLARIGYILSNRHLHAYEQARVSLEVFFAGRKHLITADRLQILNLLLSTYETAVLKNHQLEKTKRELQKLNEELETKVQERTSDLRAEIAERKQAEESLRESEERYRRLAELSPDGITVHSEGKIVYANTVAARLVGAAMPEELVGRTVFDFVHPNFHEMGRGRLRRVLEAGETAPPAEEKLVRLDGTYFDAELTCGPFVHEGKPAAISVIRDITEKKALQEKMLRNQRLESLGTLAGGIAHDLNNVLAPILMSLEILQMKFTDEQSQKFLSTIASSAQRGAELVKQILAFSRGMQGERVAVQLRHVVRELQGIIRVTFPKSITLQVQMASDLWTVNGHATQMHQVLMNLCVNARDAMPEGGKLTLSGENLLLDETFARMNPAAKPGPYVLLTVSDTGSGMTPEVQRRIFEPFFTTKEPDKGTGLGLSTVHTLVKNHGGFVNVYSEVGHGTRFKLYFPAEPSEDSQRIQTERVPSPTGHGEWILIVDDEPAIQQIAQETLEMYGYRTLTASNGAEAVGIFAKHAQDVKLLLTDIMMPVMDGLATAHAIRLLAPHVKVIAASGLGSETRETDPQKLGVDAFLRKPFTAETLLRTVAGTLGG